MLTALKSQFRRVESSATIVPPWSAEAIALPVAIAEEVTSVIAAADFVIIVHVRICPTILLVLDPANPKPSIDRIRET
ncbi:hypothetical protein [Mycobacterium sp. 852002-51163_SCH5372311]|uniref:hypothetical protein n=1 Tax=Mycobacterium sp. 852002-51163_SCH5372311 TaxID=1834097 RepID=UPI001E5BF4CF|nr:hypothetical protein [Mycobacterium sp. 852002-51163_SCH5372311]